MENNKAVQFIKLVSKPRLSVYVNKLGTLAIGYNHTSNVHKGTTCIKEEADEWLRKDVYNLDNFLHRTFPYQLNINQTTALISLIQEITIDTFRSSNLFLYLQFKQYTLAEQEFKAYTMENTSVLRRLQEQNLFNYRGNL